MAGKRKIHKIVKKTAHHAKHEHPKHERALKHEEHKAKPHKGPVRGKGKMEVEFVTHVPDGEKKRIRHRVDNLSEILTLETNIDKLYAELLKGEVKVKDVAKEFGVDPSLVEEWGRILEDHGLAELHYPAFGELVIRVKNAPKPVPKDEEEDDQD